MHVLLSLLILPLVCANTEIRNFAASTSAAHPDFALDVNTVLLPRSTTTHTLLRAPPSTPPSELWATLDLDSGDHAKYSLRLSWPGSMPTDFSMDIFDPVDAAAILNSHVQQDKPTRPGTYLTRRKYVRILAVDAGVRTPPSTSAFSFYYPFAPYVSNASAQEVQDERVEFFLTLDPLVFGVLPESLLPFLGIAALTLAFMGTFVLPRVQAGIAALVADVHSERQKQE